MRSSMPDCSAAGRFETKLLRSTSEPPDRLPYVRDIPPSRHRIDGSMTGSWENIDLNSFVNVGCCLASPWRDYNAMAAEDIPKRETRAAALAEPTQKALRSRGADVRSWINGWLAKYPRRCLVDGVGGATGEDVCEQRPQLARGRRERLESRRSEYVRKRCTVVTSEPLAAALLDHVDACEGAPAAPEEYAPLARVGAAQLAAELGAKLGQCEALPCACDLPAGISKQLHSFARALSTEAHAKPSSTARSRALVLERREAMPAVNRGPLQEFLEVLEEDDLAQSSASPQVQTGTSNTRTAATVDESQRRKPISSKSISARRSSPSGQYGKRDICGSHGEDASVPVSVARSQQRVAEHRQRSAEKEKAAELALRQKRFGSRDARLRRFALARGDVSVDKGEYTAIGLAEALASFADIGPDAKQRQPPQPHPQPQLVSHVID